MEELPLVAICVATFRRPEYLGGLLRSLESIEQDTCRAHLIVVDNDATGSARDTVLAYKVALPIPVTYLIEPERGLASVRNRLIQEARALGADFVSFVDDDQLVQGNWLRELLATQRATNAPVVWGMALPQYEPGVPAYIRETGYFEPRKVRTDGAPANEFATNNLLISLQVLEHFEKPFDERRNLIGGEDTKLAAKLRQQGVTIVRSPHSVVLERIGPSRGTAKWVIRRRFREGYIRAISIREESLDIQQVAKLLLLAAAVAVKHAGLFIPRMLTRGWSGIVVSVAGVSSSVGMIAGLSGFRHEEYRRTYGQ